MPPRDLRRVLSDAFERMEAADQERVTEMGYAVWEAAMTAIYEELVRGVEIICKDCGQKRLYDIPVQRLDVLTVAKTLEILQTLTWGKPAEPERRVSITVTTREELALKSDEELELVAGSVDAEWAPLELEEVGAGGE